MFAKRLATVALLFAVPLATCEGGELEDVLESVAGGEALFETFAARVRQTYEGKALGTGRRVSTVTEYEFLLDGDRLRLAYADGKADGLDAAAQSYRRDGRDSTHLLDGSGGRDLLLVCDRPRVPPAQVRPHMLPLPKQIGNVRLSEWLQGGTDRGTDEEPFMDAVAEAVPRGRRTVGGLECEVVDALKTNAAGDVVARYELALAVDRHHLPVRSRCFITKWGESHPVDETVIEEFAEAAPGVFAPSRLRTRKWREWTLGDPEPELVFTRETVLTDADIAPPIPPDTFAMLEPPEGAVVRTYRGSDLVEERFNDTEGGRPVPAVPGRPGRPTPVWIYAAAGLAAAAAVWLLFVKRR